MILSKISAVYGVEKRKRPSVCFERRTPNDGLFILNQNIMQSSNITSQEAPETVVKIGNAYTDPKNQIDYARRAIETQEAEILKEAKGMFSLDNPLPLCIDAMYNCLAEHYMTMLDTGNDSLSRDEFLTILNNVFGLKEVTQALLSIRDCCQRIDDRQKDIQLGEKGVVW